MNIFPDQPEVSTEDTKRLLDLGYLRSWNCLNAALTKNNPCAEDLKKLVQIEVWSANPREPIVQKLIIRVQKREREDILVNIEAYLSAR
jgi:hypothetical protein